MSLHHDDPTRADRDAPDRSRGGLRMAFRDVLIGSPRSADDGDGGLRADGSTTVSASESRTRRLTGIHRWYAGSLVGLSFLVYAMVQVAVAGGWNRSVLLFELFAVCFGVFYVFAPMRVGGFQGGGPGTIRKLATLAVMVAITVPMIVLVGTGVTPLWIYVGIAGAILFPFRSAVVISLTLAAGMVIVSGLADAQIPWELALVLVAMSLWMSGFAGNIRLTIELRATREQLARTAVAAERERIGRDLHDILGHSLTAIAVKAGLARRLLDRDASQASAEIAGVEQLARDALTDVRATAAGYRDVSVAGELAAARSVLASAGIRADIPVAADDVSRAGREVFGYVVREGVTNIVRHSGARSCSIELTRTMLRITDDGPGDEAGRSSARQLEHGIGAEDGTGLRGLADRVAAVGGVLDAGTIVEGGFRLTATVPEPGSAENDVMGDGRALRRDSAPDSRAWPPAVSAPAVSTGLLGQ